MQLNYMQYHVHACDPERGPTYALAKQFGQTLIENCREMIDHAPLYKDGTSAPLCLPQDWT